MSSVAQPNPSVTSQIDNGVFTGLHGKLHTIPDGVTDSTEAFANAQLTKL